MQTEPEKIETVLTQHDQQELDQVIDVLELSDRTLTIFAIAPEVNPKHPVVQHLRDQLAKLEEPLAIAPLFYYSDDTLYDYLQRLDAEPSEGRRVVMAFGLESLKFGDAARFGREMKQLNLGREEIFKRNLVLIFWLNRADFLDEFRRQAPDFWDWRGSVARFVARPPFDPIFYPYLEWLIAENSRLKVGGVRQVQRQVDIFLDQIYISLQGSWVGEQNQSGPRERVGVQRGSRGRGTVSLVGNVSSKGLEQSDFRSPYPEDLMADSRDDEIDISTTRRVVYLDLAEAVQQHTYCVILGNPGAGKTTLLRYLARHHALAKQDNQPTAQGGARKESLGEAKLPILFRIAEYAEQLKQQRDRGSDLSLEDYLRRFYRQWDRYFEQLPGDEVAQWLLEKLDQGECLVLLDGLDEVFDAASRNDVVQQIEQFVGRYSHNRFVITSRIAGYQEASLGNRFQEFTIREMESNQIEDFLQRWCLAVETSLRPEVNAVMRERDAKQEAEGIVQAIADQPGVRRFAANPLLLTILALIQRNEVRLPQRRVELYELATKTLIEDWQFARNLSYGARRTELILSEEEVIALLAPLAFWMHEHKPSGLITQAEVEAQLTPRMAELQGVDETTAQALVGQFLRKVREVTGLFVERALASYGFMHLTFEEYFAARHITDNDIPDILKIISPYREQVRWNEPILLALGYLSTDVNRVTRLMQELFRDLNDYQPIAGREIRLKQQPANQFVLVWQTGSSSDAQSRESALIWRDLLFAGQVLAEVKVNANLRKRLIEKLVITYLCLDDDYEEESTQQLLKLLRRIELFNHDVLELLQQATINENLSAEQQHRAWAAIVYVACGMAGELLVAQVIDFVNHLTPALFSEIRDLVAELGADMTPALERSLENPSLDVESRQALEFVTGLLYLRSDNYDHAITWLQPLTELVDCYLDSYIQWAIAIAHEKKENYEQGLHYYQQCSEKLQSLILWKHQGDCHRLHQQYTQSLECFHQALALARQNDRKAEARILWHIGEFYQNWGKYNQAITHYKQSRDRYQQLNKDKEVATRWHNIADCYKEWSKYSEALKCQQKCLEIRQALDDRALIAVTYFQFGQIYQDWGKYEEAIAHYEQSRDLYQDLDLQKKVAHKTWWLADCYREWGKYKKAIASYQQSQNLYEALGIEKTLAEVLSQASGCYKDWGKYKKAVEVQLENLDICQKLEDKATIADAYHQLGRIYQAWGEYEQAITHYEQSRNRYQKLEKKKNVADLWYWMADCYKAWGKYLQALEYQQRCLEVRRNLDDQALIAFTYYQFGRIYQAWGKYKEAIAHHEQSRDLCQKLEQETNLATQWYYLAECYKAWGKYSQALECQQKCLEIRQPLDDQTLIAVTHYQFGRIYQAWGKYEEAIAHHEQSRNLYQQLEREKDVANLWYWMADCYREWGKHEQALVAELQDLIIRQKLDDQPNIADAYYQLGYIYRNWGKYEEAIAHYEQSRDLYQQLEKEKNVANLWYWMADCYREWGKHEQALVAELQDLIIRQKLDDQPNTADAYYQLGRIYQDWGKYEQAIVHYEQSRDLYEQLGNEKQMAWKWDWLSACYREWGRFREALECGQKCLEAFQKLNGQSEIASAYYSIGRVYQAWGKYGEAIAHHEQSRDLYRQLEKEKNVANQLAWLGDCYETWDKYEKAIVYYQESCDRYKILNLQQDIAYQLSYLADCYRKKKDYATAIHYYQNSLKEHQLLGHNRNAAIRLRQLSDTWRLQAKASDPEQAAALLQQAEQHLQQAWQLDSAGDYRQNLAYDCISQALLTAESLRWLEEAAVPDAIAQFEALYRDGFARFTELGQTVDLADEALDIARAYLEISPLKNYDRAEELAQQALQTFEAFNRSKLKAAAYKLLGEIYLARAQQQESEAAATASQFLSTSLYIYRELNLTEKAAEVEQLML